MSVFSLALNERRSKAQDLGTDLVCVRVAKVAEDCLGALIGVASAIQVTRGLEGVTEMNESIGFVVAVAHVFINGERMVKAVGSLLMLAELPIGVAKAIPSICLATAVANLYEQAKGLLAAS
jgi:hypothetical protein